MNVTEIQDDDEIMGVLGQDRAWSAYAISDMEPPYRQYARFLGARADGRVHAVALIYTPPGFTALLPFGENSGVQSIMRDVPNLPERPFLVVSQGHRAIVERRYRLDVWTMYRMVVRRQGIVPPLRVRPAVRRLSPDDLAQVEDLYRHWESTFFQPELLAEGLYAGAFMDGQLVAIAGTHTRSRRTGIGTIGGVFTHPDYRGRGLATAVTAMVVESLAEEGIELIALNVRQTNHPALVAYRRIGFQVHMPYWEGNAILRSAE